ncbi:PepSY-like domain-containing protein [Bacteroidales bacterium OttesenSCG-928-L03]|nr:PepSY-like domain-containing protein [Bacteroidales bacterium OttesenSCG-928-L03]
MKKNPFFILFALCGLVFYSCDDDNIKVSNEFQSAFEARYPDAQRVEWEKEYGYYVADFWKIDEHAEAEAWFDKQAGWQMTVTEITFNDLPQEVKASFDSSEYGNWYTDDTDKVERPDKGLLYVIEVEKGKTEYDLYFAPDGRFIKAVKDTRKNKDHHHYLTTE